jgi:hypothetical protein
MRCRTRRPRTPTRAEQRLRTQRRTPRSPTRPLPWASLIRKFPLRSWRGLIRHCKNIGVNPQSISVFNRIAMLLYANDPAALRMLVQTLQKGAQLLSADSANSANRADFRSVDGANNDKSASAFPGGNKHCSALSESIECKRPLPSTAGFRFRARWIGRVCQVKRPTPKTRLAVEGKRIDSPNKAEFIQATLCFRHICAKCDTSQGRIMLRFCNTRQIVALELFT